MFSGNSWAIASQINDRKEVKTEKMLLGGGVQNHFKSSTKPNQFRDGGYHCC